MSVGARVKALREARGWTLAELAEVSAVSRSYLWKLESEGETNPSLDVLKRLAKTFGTTIARLIDEEGLHADAVPDSGQPIPAHLDPGLREFLDERRKIGAPVPDDELTMLMGLQRRDKHKISRDDWYTLYQVVNMVTKRERGK